MVSKFKAQDIIGKIFNGKDYYNQLKNYFDKQLSFEDILYLYELARIYKLNKNMNIKTPKNDIIYKIFCIINQSEANKLCKLLGPQMVVFNENEDICYDNLLFSAIITYHSINNFFILLRKSIYLFDNESIINMFKSIIKKIGLSKIKKSSNDSFKRIIFVLCDICRFFEFEPNIESQIEDYFQSYSQEYQYNDETESIMKNIRHMFLMLNNLDARSANFLYLAKFIKDVIDNLPTADYSICTLQYYKVIEIEIKKRILYETIKNLNDELIFEDIKQRKIIPLNYYSIDWIESISLGNIHFLLKDYCKYIENKHYKRNNKCSLETSKFYDNIYSLIPDYKVITMLLNTTHNSMIQKFRNPPAHTNPCGIDECVAAEDILFNFLWGITLLTKVCDWLEIDISIFDNIIGNKKIKEEDVKKYYQNDK